MPRSLQFLIVMLLCLAVCHAVHARPRWQRKAHHHGPKTAQRPHHDHKGKNHWSIPVEMEVQADANCPLHPATNDLPSPLPNDVTDALKQVENYLVSFLNSTNLPGIAYSVTYKGSTLKSGGLGVKNKESSDVPDSNTIFRIASVTKVFTILSLFQLFARGQVTSLDDPLVKYCSGFSMMTDYNITLRQMASQMSGLPREAPCGAPDGLNVCPASTSQVLQGLKNQMIIHPPWTRPSYSNLAYSLIGNCVLENFYPNLTFEKYVKKYILEPLGMTRTGFNFSNSIQSMMATGYNADGSPALLYDLGWTAPSGQMYSTTHDLDILARFFMRDNKSSVDNSVLPLSLKREMQLQLYTNRDRLTGFGTPWEIRFQDNYTVLNKGGYLPGFSALFSFVPELQLSLNILFAGSADKSMASSEAYHTLIPALVESLIAVQTPYPYPPDPEVYVGVFKITRSSEGFVGPANININITTFQNQLLMTRPLNVFLAYGEPLNLQVAFPDNVQPCILQELLAIKGQWLYFAPPVNGKSPSFTIPGFYNNVVFYRV